uniref:Cdc42 binding domain-containing protein n=1 Tax=Mustela putorius furo TaxID=9669 RepID=M3Y5C0_MUSPF
MSTAGVAAQEIRVPLKTGYLHDGQAMRTVRTCWGGRSEFENHFLNIDPITMAYSLNSTAQEHLASLGITDSREVSNLHRKMSWTHYLDSPKYNIFQNYSASSKPGNGHCPNTQMCYFIRKELLSKWTCVPLLKINSEINPGILLGVL